MEFFPTSRIFLQIGPLSIYWYAVLICIGGIAAYLISSRLMKQTGLTNDQIDDITIGIIIFGLIGARLWYCLYYNPVYYFSNPLNLLRVHEGGLAIHGGLIGAILFGFFYCKKNHLSLLRISDCILPNVLLAQGIGRWGNFINKEAYGNIVSEKALSWLPQFIQDGMLIDGYYRQPMFLLESVMDIVGFVVIAYVMTRFFTLKRGDRSFFYMMWYGISRFIVEIFRTDALMIGPFKIAQLISITAFIIGLLGYLGVFNKLITKDKPFVIFDFDGTLVDTSEAIGASMEKTLIAHDLGGLYTETFKKDMLGPSPKDLFAKYCPDCDALAMQEEYRDYNWDDQKEHNKLFPGCKELLTSLKEQGYKLGIVSTKAKNVLEFGLDMFNLKDYFDVVVGGDEVTHGKPNPEGLFNACNKLKVSKDNAIYIGDSVNDIKAGHNAGMYTVAYTSYPSKKEDLLQSGANEYISSLSELTSVIESNKIYSSSGR